MLVGAVVSVGWRVSVFVGVGVANVVVVGCGGVCVETSVSSVGEGVIVGLSAVVMSSVGVSVRLFDEVSGMAQDVNNKRKTRKMKICLK